MIQQDSIKRDKPPIGISDIGVHIADRGLPVDEIIAGRSADNVELRERLDKANTVAGQRYVRFPEDWEDAVTLGAEAARKVLLRFAKSGDYGLRVLAVGTETAVDHAKPVAAYIQGLLKAAGCDLGTSLTTLQLQHACAASTMGLLHTAGFLQAAPRPGQRGLVLSTDISRYASASSAELTQGAGAVAVLVEHDPKLLEIDLTTVGQYSTDADDFFRPLGQSTAQVRGTYSIKCYRKALMGAFRDHCEQRGQEECEVLEDADFFVLHTPFRNMPELAFDWLLHRHGMGANGDGLFARARGECLKDATDEIAFTGNLYNGSIYYVLAHLLQNLYQALGDEMVGKKIVLGSYGSGATMLVLQTVVTPGAPGVVRNWTLPHRETDLANVGFEAFRSWADNYDANLFRGHGSPEQADRFYLKEIRSDGYRIYDIS